LVVLKLLVDPQLKQGYGQWSTAKPEYLPALPDLILPIRPPGQANLSVDAPTTLK
jgi:hypothetical protein